MNRFHIRSTRAGSCQLENHFNPFKSICFICSTVKQPRNDINEKGVQTTNVCFTYNVYKIILEHYILSLIDYLTCLTASQPLKFTLYRHHLYNQNINVNDHIMGLGLHISIQSNTKIKSNSLYF